MHYRCFEFFFLGLRLKEGVSLTECKQKFGDTLLESVTALIHTFREDGLMTHSNDRIALSPKGLMIADSIIEQFSTLK